MESISEHYFQLVNSKKLKKDQEQLKLVSLLDRLKITLEKPERRKFFWNKRRDVKGIYIWGGVGTGKSLLMELFVKQINVPVHRIHFHTFMQEVQAALHEARLNNEEDALLIVCKRFSKGIRVIALDEMQVKDIADAMIVSRLFECLHKNGIVTITTSNRKPEDLYLNGLNRQLFLPFIDFLKKNLTVHKLDGGNDYRRNKISSNKVYFTPLSKESQKKMDEIWSNLTDKQDFPFSLFVKGRELKIPSFRNGVGRFAFPELCGKPLGSADYIALSENIRVLVLDDIPQLSRNNFNEAKRFVTLIDIIYEARINLICSAEAEPEMLYLEGEGVFEFSRTASRLREMQSTDWLLKE